MSILSNLTTMLKSVVSLDAFVDHSLGMSDLILPEIPIEPGLFLNRDKSLQQSFIYSGANFEATTLAELRYMNAMLYSNGFSNFGDNWCMHLSCIRSHRNNYIDENDCYFPDATTKTIDDERRFEFLKTKDHYANKFILTFNYMPPGKLHGAIKNLFYSTPDGNNQTTKQEHLEYFKQAISDFRAAISSRVYTEPLLDDETLRILHRSINGFDHKLQADRGAYLPLYYRLATQDLKKGIIPKIGDLNIGVVSVGEGLPVKVWPGYTHELSTLDFEYTWVTRFIFESKETSEKRINDTADYHYQNQSDGKKALQKRLTGFERTNRSALTFADQSESALEALETSNRVYGNYTCSVVVFDPDKDSLNKKLSEIQKTVSSLNFVTKREKENCLDAYFGTIPGMRYANVRKWQVDTINLSDLMPTTDVWDGYEYNPCEYYKLNNPPLFYAVADGETIFSGCTFVQDTGHAFVVGSTRSGKSVALNFLAAQHFRYRNAQIFHFDNGYSGMPLCYASNGNHYDIASDNATTTFKPLQLLIDGGMEDFSFLVQWLSHIAEINLSRTLTSQERSEISDVLVLVKNSPTPEQKSITYFHFLLSSRAEGQDIARAFIEYSTRSGKNSIKSTIFNSPVDKFKFSRFTMFELEKVAKLSNDVAIPILEYMFYMVYRSLDGRPTMITFEEIASTFKTEILQNVCEDWLRKIGKKNAWLLLCTQQVNDILNSPIADVILDQCKTKIYLPNSSLTTTEQSYRSYQKMGLNDKQISIIASAIPQQNYYLSNPLGARLINFRLSATALAFLAKNSPEDLKIARTLKKKHGDMFGYYWLKHFGHIHAAEYWLTQHKGLESEKTKD